MTIDLIPEERLKEKLFKQFKGSPLIQDIMEIIADPMQDTVDALCWMDERDGFNEWIGFELDWAGSILGIPRPLAQVPLDHLFTIIDEGEEGDERTGFADENDPVIGGNLADENGLPSIDEPGSLMDDEGYRRLLKQKAAALRKRMLRQTLFEYLLAFGSQCLIDDDTPKVVEMDPINYYDLSHWEKWYVLNKGFKPAATKTLFRGNIRNGDQI